MFNAVVFIAEMSGIKDFKMILIGESISIAFNRCICSFTVFLIESYILLTYKSNLKKGEGNVTSNPSFNLLTPSVNNCLYSLKKSSIGASGIKSNVCKLAPICL